MKKILVIFSLALFLTLGILVLKGQAKTDATRAYETKQQTMGAVEVVVVPEQLETNSPAVFSLSLNNHSVELNYDYTKIAKLTDDRGSNYQALSWEGGSGGHHLEGKLTFEPLEKRADSITLTLSGIDGQTKDFTWLILP